MNGAKVLQTNFEPPEGVYLLFDPQSDRLNPYVTTCKHVFKSNLLTVQVPTGFRFDFASVPKLLLWLFDPRGRHQRAAMFHDSAYRMQYCSRFQADAIFREIMEFDHVPMWRMLLLYWAVRVFGGRAWKENASDKKLKQARKLIGDE